MSSHTLDPDDTLCVAAGVAGYAIAIELLEKLIEKGILSDQEHVDVLDRALACLESLTPQLHPIWMARNLLWSNITAGDPPAD